MIENKFETGLNKFRITFLRMRIWYMMVNGFLLKKHKRTQYFKGFVVIIREDGYIQARIINNCGAIIRGNTGMG